MSFPLFKDVDKVVTNFFKDDFDFQHALKTKAKGPNGVTVTNTTNFYSPLTEKPIPLTGKITTKWEHESGFTVDKLELKSDGGIVVETSLAKVTPGLTLEFKGDDSNKADIGFVYKHEHATVAGEVDVAEFSAAKASVVTGANGVNVGVSTSVTLDKFDVKTLDFAVGYTHPSKIFAGFRATNKFSQFGLTLYHFACSKYQVGGSFTYNPEKAKATAVVGASYACCPDTTIKAKVCNEGKVAVSVKQALKNNTTVTGVAEVPVNDMCNYKLGLTLTLG